MTTGWQCNHTQTTSKRCIRCCSSKPKYYVLRRAAGGSPPAYRWLCQPCFDVYEAIGLIEGMAPEYMARANIVPGKALRLVGA